MLKVSESISQPFERFDTIVDTFYHTVAESVCKEIQNIIFPSLESFDKSIHCLMIEFPCFQQPNLCQLSALALLICASNMFCNSVFKK